MKKILGRMVKVGRYERVLLRGMNREGGCINKSVKEGYSEQVTSLKKKGLIKITKNNLCLTKEGKNKLKKGFSYDKSKFAN